MAWRYRRFDLGEVSSHDHSGLTFWGGEERSGTWQWGSTILYSAWERESGNTIRLVQSSPFFPLYSILNFGVERDIWYIIAHVYVRLGSEVDMGWTWVSQLVSSWGRVGLEWGKLRIKLEVSNCAYPPGWLEFEFGRVFGSMIKFRIQFSVYLPVTNRLID